MPLSSRVSSTAAAVLAGGSPGYWVADWMPGVLGVGRATSVAPARAVREWADRQDHQSWGAAVEAGEIAGWTLVVELNGCQAAGPATGQWPWSALRRSARRSAQLHRRCQLR